METAVLILASISSLLVGFGLGIFFIYHMQHRVVRKMEQREQEIAESFNVVAFGREASHKTNEEMLSELEEQKVVAIKNDQFELVRHIDVEIEKIKRKIG